MKTEVHKTARTVRFLKWIRDHSGYWYLICTPNEEHMDLDMAKRLLTELYQQGFYEMIFVLLSVHRENPCFAHLSEYLLLDSFIARWNDESDDIIREMTAHLE